MQYSADGIKQFKPIFGIQKYNVYFAFNMPQFKEAVRYFVRQMRITDFVSAHDRLEKKYEVNLAAEVEIFCQLSNITYRPSCGRIFLASGFEKRLP